MSASRHLFGADLTYTAVASPAHQRDMMKVLTRVIPALFATISLTDHPPRSQLNDVRITVGRSPAGARAKSGDENSSHVTHG